MVDVKPYNYSRHFKLSGNTLLEEIMYITIFMSVQKFDSVFYHDHIILFYAESLCWLETSGLTGEGYSEKGTCYR